MGKVYSVSANKFKVDVSNTSTPSYVSIANMTALNVNLSPVIDSWYAMDQGGWQSNMKGGFAGTIQFDLKKTYDDAGNAALFSTAFTLDPDKVVKNFQWTWPDGTVVTFEGLVSIESVGGNTENAENASVTIYINNAPTVTPA